MSTLEFVLLILSAVSSAIGLWQWRAASTFVFAQKTKHTSNSPPSLSANVSILKPIKGAESTTEHCLRSWFIQAGSQGTELIFGVQATTDPAVGVIKKLMQEFPNVDCTIVNCVPGLGVNSKVSKLIHLSKLARYDTFVVSDADVWAPPQLLSTLVGALQRPGVGLVHCFYQHSNPMNLPMRLESIAINADFWSQVLQSAQLKSVDFAMGATMAFRKQDLKSIGGFEAFSNHLADDYYLGNHLSKLGLKIVFSPLQVHCFEAPSAWLGVLQHQLRWARTIRSCQPLPYVMSVISNATLWPLACVLSTSNSHIRWLAVTAILLRGIIASNLEKRFLASPKIQTSTIILAPLKDLVNFLVWISTFFGSRIEWKGVSYSVNKHGVLSPIQRI